MPKFGYLHPYHDALGYTIIRPKYDIEDFFDRWHITAEDVRANFSIHTFDEGDMTETFAVPAVGAIIVKKVEGETNYECSEI